MTIYNLILLVSKYYKYDVRQNYVYKFTNIQMLFVVLVIIRLLQKTTHICFISVKLNN